MVDIEELIDNGIDATSRMVGLDMRKLRIESNADKSTLTIEDNAFGISEEDWWTSSNLGPDTDPDTWRIYDGKLYLFMYCTPEYKFMTRRNVSAVIEKGNAKWESFFGGTPVYNVQCLWSYKDHGGRFRKNVTTEGCFQRSTADQFVFDTLETSGAKDPLQGNYTDLLGNSSTAS